MARSGVSRCCQPAGLHLRRLSRARVHRIPAAKSCQQMNSRYPDIAGVQGHARPHCSMRLHSLSAALLTTTILSAGQHVGGMASDGPHERFESQACRRQEQWEVRAAKRICNHHGTTSRAENELEWRRDTGGTVTRSSRERDLRDRRDAGHTSGVFDSKADAVRDHKAEVWQDPRGSSASQWGLQGSGPREKPLRAWNKGGCSLSGQPHVLYHVTAPEPAEGDIVRGQVRYSAVFTRTLTTSGAP